MKLVLEGEEVDRYLKYLKDKGDINHNRLVNTEMAKALDIQAENIKISVANKEVPNGFPKSKKRTRDRGYKWSEDEEDLIKHCIVSSYPSHRTTTYIKDRLNPKITMPQLERKIRAMGFSLIKDVCNIKKENR